MLVQASWTEEGRVVFRLYCTGAEVTNGMRGICHLYILKNVKSAFLACIFILFRRCEFTKSFTVSSWTQNVHAQTVYTRPRFPPPTRPGYEATNKYTYIYISYMALIGMHELHGRMHPN